jgi:hypothetical protein
MPIPMQMPGSMQMPNGGFDPAAGIPPHMMYPGGMPMLTPGDQAQLQMTQQMQQFMQMQMQFMQMMAGQGQDPAMGRPMSHMPGLSVGTAQDMNRHSFLGGPSGMGNGMGGLEPSRGEAFNRTMSMVQPSNASWMQQVPNPGFAPSIRLQGNGYAPSIAPSERSNIGLPGRYRPVSSIQPLDTSARTKTMSGAIPNFSKSPSQMNVTPVSSKDDDEDDEEGWEAMKAKRDQKKSLWRSKKNTLGNDISADMIS